MTKTVFWAMGVYGWNEKDPVRATFSFEPDGALFTVDSTLRPANGASTRRWIVDDRYEDGGATWVGPSVSEGGLYVEQQHAEKNNYPLPPAGYDDYRNRTYEFMAVQYSVDDSVYAGRRYYGFHAIWESGPREAATMLIYDAGNSLGTSNSRVARKTMNIDDVAVLLPQAQMPAGVIPKPSDIRGGALFLRCGIASEMLLSIPKLPQILDMMAKVSVRAVQSVDASPDERIVRCGPAA